MNRQLYGLQYIKFFIIVYTASIFFSCQKEPIEFVNYPEVTSELCPFFSSFEREAAKRGLTIDLKTAGIKGRITKITGRAVGICQKHSGKEILIDQKFWKGSSRLSKELIVFHELGHCFLGRMHNNQKAANGTCESIMRNGLGGCIDFYNKKTRRDLLDEFFSN